MLQETSCQTPLMPASKWVKWCARGGGRQSCPTWHQGLAMKSNLSASFDVFLHCDERACFSCPLDWYSGHVAGSEPAGRLSDAHSEMCTVINFMFINNKRHDCSNGCLAPKRPVRLILTIKCFWFLFVQLEAGVACDLNIYVFQCPCVTFWFNRCFTTFSTTGKTPFSLQQLPIVVS